MRYITERKTEVESESKIIDILLIVGLVLICLDIIYDPLVTDACQGEVLRFNSTRFFCDIYI